MWIEELRQVTDVQAVFQPWKIPKDEQTAQGLEDLDIVKQPLKRIDFKPGNKQRKQPGRKKR